MRRPPKVDLLARLKKDFKEPIPGSAAELLSMSKAELHGAVKGSILSDTGKPSVKWKACQADTSAPRFKTYTVKRARAQFERMLADVAAGCVVEITRQGNVVASMLDVEWKAATTPTPAKPSKLAKKKAGK